MDEEFGVASLSRGPPLRAVVRALAAAVGGARGALFPFAPVALGTGVAIYFALPAEPAPVALILAGVAAVLALWGARRGPEAAQPAFWALALALAGLALAGARTQSVAAPVLGWHRYGPVEGRIVAIDRSGTGAVRLTLDQVVLPGLDPARTPGRVRVSVQGEGLDVDPVAGRRVMLTGHLGPPGGPVEPGGFDFRRFAWFEGLGAVGYTRSPVLALAEAEPGWSLRLTRWRHRISAAIRSRLPGEAGGFVAAILTGDRSGVGQQTLEDLRRSNLSHLLAISGLHMGLLTGVVYGALRALLALVPVLALRLPIRKIAALGALAAALAYLALSGGNIATQRAFVMAGAMLGALLADRQAVSLRSVALAALLLLAWRPEAVLSVGFQMSFAATVALVAVFRALRDRRRGRAPARRGLWRRALDPVLTAALCSLVAGLATGPFAAAAFNRFAEYGLVANLLSVPLMGVLVMPAAVLAAVLWPLGLEGVGLHLMGLGTRWILAVAARVADLDGAVRPIPASPGWVVPVLALGGLWLALWPGRMRWAGAAVVALALAGWGMDQRPALLVDRDGALAGVLGPEGRVLSRARGAGFVAAAWLEADGDGAGQAQAAARRGMSAVPGGTRFDVAGAPWLHLYGRAGAAALEAACVAGVTIVTDAERPEAPGPCRLFDATRLARSGALAVTASGQVIGAEALAGRRPWTRPP